MDEKKDITGGLKKILLAGVGAASITKEKAGEFLEDLAKKGEDVVGQSDSLKEKLNDAEEMARSAGEKAKSTLKETADRFAAVKDLDFSEILDRLTPEQFKALKDQILKKGDVPADEEEGELFCEVAEEMKAKDASCCSEEKAEEDCCCSDEKPAEEGCCCSDEKPAEESCCSDEKPAEEGCCSDEKPAEEGCCCSDEKPAEEGCCSDEKPAEEAPTQAEA